jgi:putative hydrolase of the HAD superfamily
MLFDFGGPLLLTPFELHHVGAPRLGVPAEELPGGPFDPADLRWKAREVGEITERQYWSEQASRFDLTVVQYMRYFYEPSGDQLVRPMTAALVDEVRRAGRQVALLTNDLTAFHGVEWQSPISVLRKISPIVDLSHSGNLKPHPKAYEHAAEAMGLDPDEIVFTDDHYDNVEAGALAGFASVWFDVTDVAGSVDRIRRQLALEES